jgi:glycerol kinase
MPFVLALDQGTTSSRAILFDEDGRPRAIAQRELPQHYPQPGWVEHDPFEIWQTQEAVAVEVLARAGIRAAEVAALGITNQRETTLLWDRRDGRPGARAIVWQDRRTARICEEWRREVHEAAVRQRTGLVIDAYFSASKAAWMLAHAPGARALAEAGHLAFGTVDTWLLWQLTGGALHATDASNASRTMLFDIRRGTWDDELLALAGLPRAAMPAVVASTGPLGEARTGPLAGIPIAGVAGDQQAALFGQLCLAPGLAKCTYGTGCFHLQNVGSRPAASRHRLLTTVAWQIDGRTTYALEGSVFVGGAVVQWLRDGLGIIESAADVEELASTVPDAGGVVFVPAFTGLGAPHWDPHARGAILGLTRGTTAGHIARAALESIAFQVADLVDAMRADAPVPGTELRVDGGAAANGLLLQLQADLLGMPVVRPLVTETTALGAAYLAGLGVGLWRNAAELDGRWSADCRVEPQLPPAQAEARRGRWREAVARARQWEEGAQ